MKIIDINGSLVTAGSIPFSDHFFYKNKLYRRIALAEDPPQLILDAAGLAYIRVIREDTCEVVLFRADKEVHLVKTELFWKYEE